MEQNTNYNQQNQPVPQQNTEKHTDNMPDNQNNRKVVTIAVVILVIIVLAALLASGRLGKKANAPKQESASSETATLPEGCKEGYKFSVVTGEPCPASTGATATTSSKDNKDTLISDEEGGYSDIIKQYTGRLALLDKDCKPAIATQTFVPGTRFLIANDSTTSHEVHFNGKAVILSPYHYVTSTLKEEGKFNISCDSADIATITVETKK